MTETLKIISERVADLPLLVAQLERMGVPALLGDLYPLGGRSLPSWTSLRISLQGFVSIRANRPKNERTMSYKVALGVFRGSGNKSFQGTALNSSGDLYRAQGRYGEALACYQQALIILREVGDQAGESRALNNIGAVYQTQKRFIEAQPYLEAGAALIDSLRQGSGLSLV